nr:uncharacterized protein LOC129254049 [Lytechinus pictus]
MASFSPVTSKAIVVAAFLILAEYLDSTHGRSCAVGENANSSFFSSRFVFGYIPNGRDLQSQGDFGFQIQSRNLTQPQVDILNPSGLAFVEVPIPNTHGVPPKNALEDVFHIKTEADSMIHAFNGDPSPRSVDSYGTFSVIPEEYLGQEYFLVTMTGQSPGYATISSMNSSTRVNIRFNGRAQVYGGNYDRGDEKEFCLEPWKNILIKILTNDFSGSRLLADHPVSVVCGTPCAFSPGHENWDQDCDAVIEQLTPFDRWGTAFNVPSFPGDDEDFCVMIVAGRNGTTVTMNLDTVITALLDEGETVVECTNLSLARLTSNKPIQVVALKTVNAAMVSIPPEEQYISGDTYIYVPDATTYGVSSGFITVVTSCEFNGVFNVTRVWNDTRQPQLGPMYESKQHNGSCALYYDLVMDATYEIMVSDLSASYFALVNSFCAETAGSSVGAQGFKRLRCIDYDSMFTGDNACHDVYRSSSFSFSSKGNRITQEPDQEYFTRTTFNCASACAQEANAICKAFTWSKVTGACRLYGSFNPATDTSPETGGYIYTV